MTTLRVNKTILTFPNSIIEIGSKPNRPIDLIKKILPKTPEIVLPIKPKVYFLKMYPVILAPIIPIKTLINDIKVAVIDLF